MAETERILIVGGGIGGLTLAAALHRKGFEAEIIERSPTWEAIGAGIAVQSNGMRILNALGLGASVEQAGAVIRSWGFCDQRGEMLCEVDLEALWGDVAPFIGIDRTSLQHALVRGAAPVPCRLGTSITALTQTGDRVRATFTDGSTREYGLVVGADGISSTVRRLTLTAAGPIDLGAMNWRSIAPIRPGGLTALRFLLGDGCFFGLCPVGGGRTYGFAYVMQPRVRDPLDGRLERLRHRFAEFGDLVQEFLASLQDDEQIHCAAMEWVNVDVWHTGRVVLIGDAAHASSPLMGQGGCMAMEDAYVLAEELCRASSVEGALESYVGRRRSRVLWVQRESMATAETLRMPPDVRNAALRDKGNPMMQARFRPLVSPP